MSYNSNDFPHTHFYDTDLRELISMYKHLTSEYAEIVKWMEENYKDYKEILEKTQHLEAEVNKCIEAIAKQNQHIDEELAKAKADLDSQFQTEINTLNNQFDTLSGQVLVKLTDMQIQLNNFNDYLVKELTKNNEKVYKHIDVLFTEFVNSLPDYENLIVYNPVRGEMTNVQTAINDLYAAFNVFGLTALQYDTLGLTATEYDSYHLTAWEYDSMGYIKLGYPDSRYYMIDPFTGLTTLIKNVVYKLCAFHMDGLTASEYDAKLLTASDYDAKLITAFDYDWFGKQILI